MVLPTRASEVTGVRLVRHDLAARRRVDAPNVLTFIERDRAVGVPPTRTGNVPEGDSAADQDASKQGNDSVSHAAMVTGRRASVSHYQEACHG